MKKSKVNIENVIARIDRAMSQTNKGAYNKRNNIWRIIGELDGYRVVKFIINSEMGKI